MDIEYFIKNWESIDKKDINFSEEQWEEISKCKYLSEGFMREFKDKVNWNYISVYQKLSEEFIREFRNRVDWGYISIDQKLSEGFMREFKDKVIWYNISQCQKLSEEFIREFKNKVNWHFISSCQTLSGRFIDEFIDYMYYENSFKNTYQERFYQSINSHLYTINKRALCCLGYQWYQWSGSKFIQLSNSTLPIIFSEVL